MKKQKGQSPILQIMSWPDGQSPLVKVRWRRRIFIYLLFIFKRKERAPLLLKDTSWWALHMTFMGGSPFLHFSIIEKWNHLTCSHQPTLPFMRTDCNFMEEKWDGAPSFYYFIPNTQHHPLPLYTLINSHNPTFKWNFPSLLSHFLCPNKRKNICWITSNKGTDPSNP